MLETISDYIDLNLLLVIFMAIFSFIVLNFVYKKISLPKIIQVIFTLLVVAANVYIIYSYIDKAESQYVSTTTEYYIKGNIEFVSSAVDKVRVKYVDTNMSIKDLDKKEVLVRITNSTKIYDKSGKRITINEIKSGNFVLVKTTRNSLKGGANEVKATKIQVY